MNAVDKDLTKDPLTTQKPEASGKPAEEEPGTVKTAQDSNKVDRETIAPSDEQEVMEWLLSMGSPVEYTVPVTLRTKNGEGKIPWVLKSLDNDLFEKIEKAHTNKETGEYNAVEANTEIVLEATVSPNLRDSAFMGNIQDPALALAMRFKYNTGVLVQLSGRVREISGYDPDLVGGASQRLTRAVKN